LNKRKIKKLINKTRFFINRRGIAYFAPVIALFRLFKQQRLNYLHQMRVLYRYAFWTWQPPLFETYTADEFVDEFCPGMKEQFEAESLLRKENLIKSMRTKTARPSNLREMMVFCHNEHCLIRWHADFERHELLIFTPSIFVPVLTDFLIALPTEDKCFAEFGIAEPLQIEAFFTIKICLEYQDLEKWYLAHVSFYYRCYEISFEELPSKGGAR
jgi:hypothetical protein